MAETALLALEHVGERFQRPFVGAGDDAAAPPIIEQGVDCFLQHALFVADDDVGRAQLDQPLEAIVAVDHAAIEVIQVGRGETSAVERHERCGIRRKSPEPGSRIIHSGLLPRLHERLDELQSLGELLLFASDLEPRDFHAQVGLHLVEIERA